MEIEQLAVERPEALARVAVDPNTGIDAAKAQRDRRRRRLRRRRQGRDRRRPAEAVDRLPRRGRDARRGQPARQDRGRRHRRPRRQGDARRERRLPPRRPRGPRGHGRTRTRSRPPPRRRTSTTSSSTAPSASSATAPGLVMSTLDVVAYAGEQFGGQKPANFLDIGGGASAEVMANGLHIILSDPQVKSVFVNVFGGITSCDAVANGIVGALDALGDEEDRPLVVRLDGNNVEEGRRILQERNHPLRDDRADDGRRRAPRRRARRRPPTDHRAKRRENDNHGYLPQRRLEGHRPGHDRVRGHEAHPAHAQVRHRHRRRRQPPQGRHHGRLRGRRLRPRLRHRQGGHRGHRRQRRR